MTLLLNIDQKNFILSVVILTLVLILLILVFSESYSLFKNKINKGGFDKQFSREVKSRKVEVDDYRDTKYVFKNARNVTIDGSKTAKFEKPRKIEVDEVFILEKKKKRLQRRTGRKVASGIFYVLCLALIGLGVYQHFSGTLLTLSDKAYAVVPTKSMSATNEENAYYLDKIEELNQIKPFSLVTLHKVENKKDIERFGIYAYRNEDKKLIIHRIVDISYRDDGVYYTFKGDNNTFADKKLVKADQVLYEYKGESNYPLGLIVGFSRSAMGFLALVYVVVGLSIIDVYESKKDKLYLEYLNSYITKTNKEQYTKLGKERIVEI